MALNANTGIRALVATTFLVSSCPVLAIADPRAPAPIDFVRKTSAQQSHRTPAGRSVSATMPRPNPSAARSVPATIPRPNPSASNDTWRGPVTRTGSGTLPQVREKIRFAYPGSVRPAATMASVASGPSVSGLASNFTSVAVMSPSLAAGGAMTAGHATLPLNSLAHVQSSTTGREIVVRVTARTSTGTGNTLALSSTAAEMLGLSRGSREEVNVRYLGPAPANPVDEQPDIQMVAAPRRERVDPAPATIPQRSVQSASDSGLFVQIGSFTKRGSANSVANRVSSNLRSGVKTVNIKGTTYHRVMVGPFRDRAAADNARSNLRSQGFRDGFVTHG